MKWYNVINNNNNNFCEDLIWNQIAFMYFF